MDRGSTSEEFAAAGAAASVLNSLEAQLAQVIVARRDARNRIGRLVVFHDVVFDTRLIRVRENLFPVNDAIAHRRQVHSIAEILPATLANGWLLLEILHVYQRESARILAEVLQRIA